MRIMGGGRKEKEEEGEEGEDTYTVKDARALHRTAGSSVEADLLSHSCPRFLNKNLKEYFNY